MCRLESFLAMSCSDFGIDGDDPTAHDNSSPLLSPAGIAGVVLAGVVAVACIAALCGEWSTCTCNDTRKHLHHEAWLGPAAVFRVFTRRRPQAVCISTRAAYVELLLGTQYLCGAAMQQWMQGCATSGCTNSADVAAKTTVALATLTRSCRVGAADELLDAVSCVEPNCFASTGPNRNQAFERYRNDTCS